ncbi:23S rRNA (adenine(2030)-N(6))-methyltransferase RlmJ [Amaricoccus macauensis]|uniref:23S rRNA (adenine(2030)-N(6))-methyltransferase RlmJ n=1 Tax=Amaricoccus macauensis TaxID=57001 RepID=UPI003C7DFD58
MLSYQHAYHAGGPADVHKHMVLAELLTLLTRKKRGISYAETHAGRGLYDLASPEAAKTGEAAHGIARLRPAPSTPYARAISTVWSAHGPTAYPGSPLVAASLLRPQDSMTLMELHPAENTALRLAMRESTAAIHRRDGYEGVLALAPLKPRKGLVLVDPSYEVKTEYEDAARFVRQLIAKWPEAAVLVWYPLLPAGRHADLLEGLAPLAPIRDEVRFTPEPERGMTGSGLALANAPYGAEAIFSETHDAAAGVFVPA